MDGINERIAGSERTVTGEPLRSGDFVATDAVDREVFVPRGLLERELGRLWVVAVADLRLRVGLRLRP